MITGRGIRSRARRIVDPRHLRRFAVRVELLHFSIEEGAKAAGVLELGQNNWLRRLALNVHAGADRNLFTELVPEVLDDFDCVVHAGPTRFTTGSEPVTQ